MIAAFALTLLCWSAAQDYPVAEALDGKAGFGAEPDQRAIGDLFRNPSEADTVFLDGLRETVVAANTRIALAAARAERQGMFRILETELGSLGDPPLMRLLQRVDEVARDPFVQAFSPEDALAFVRALSDARLRAHASLVEAAKQESAELLSAITLLHGDVHGRVELSPDTELALVTSRADLAASRLRTVLSDLQMLAEPLHGHLERLSPQQLQVARGIAAQDLSSRRDFLELKRQAEVDRSKWEGRLSRVRFDKLFGETLGDRRRAKIASLSLSQRIPRFLPTFDGEREVPQPWAGMSGTERARLAVSLGADALQSDPFNPFLNYLTGLGVEFASGPKLAGPYFARFLVLNGIRHYDHRTYESRVLGRSEEYALGQLTSSLLGTEGR